MDYVYSPGNFNEGQGVVSDNAGNVYMLGDISNQIIIQGDTFTNEYGDKDLILAKYNPEGQLVWAKVFGSTSADDASDLSIDTSNHLYAVVYIQSTTQMSDTSYSAAFDHQVIQFDTSSSFLRYLSRNAEIIADAKGNDLYVAWRSTIENSIHPLIPYGAVRLRMATYHSVTSDRKGAEAA